MIFLFLLLVSFFLHKYSFLFVFRAQVVYFNRTTVVGLAGIPSSSSRNRPHNRRSVPTQPATMVSL